MERVYKREGILFKILPCMLIAIYAVMCLYGSTVCASYDVAVDDKTYLLPDSAQDYKYHFIIQYDEYWGGYGKLIICSNYPLSIISNSNGTFTFRCPDDDGNFSSYIYCNANNNGSFDYSSKTFNEGSGFTGLDVKQGKTQNFVVLSSNSNIFLDDALFFQGASQELATIIRPKMEGIQLQEIIQEIIQLLPVILVVMVALIAIRKAITLLLTTLRNS